jgi:hypothetical protein
MAFKIKRKPFNQKSKQYDAITAFDEPGSSSRAQDADITSGDRLEDAVSPEDIFHELHLNHDMELNFSLPKPSQSSIVEHEQLTVISDLSETPQATPTSNVSANSIPYQAQNDQNAKSKPPAASKANPPGMPEDASWGVHWFQPAFIIIMLLCGLAFALSHHFYYASMNGSTAGDAAKQAWPIRFGTAFAFLVVSCLQAATASALAQYIWTVVRRKPLKICKSTVSKNPLVREFTRSEYLTDASTDIESSEPG